MTDSGYPRITKQWTRGTPLSDAEVVMEGQKEDISVGAYHSHEPNYERTVVYQGLTFYTNRVFLKGRKGLVQIDKQDSANVDFWKNYLLLELREDWTVDGQNLQIRISFECSSQTLVERKKKITVLFEPTPKTSLSYFTNTKDYLILATLDDVKSKIKILSPNKNNGPK